MPHAQNEEQRHQHQCEGHKERRVRKRYIDLAHFKGDQGLNLELRERAVAFRCQFNLSAGLLCRTVRIITAVIPSVTDTLSDPGRNTIDIH